MIIVDIYFVYSLIQKVSQAVTLTMNDFGGCWELWQAATETVPRSTRSYPMFEMFLDIRNNQLVNVTGLYVSDATGMTAPYSDYTLDVVKSSFDGQRLRFTLLNWIGITDFC